MSPLAGPLAQMGRFVSASYEAILWLLKRDHNCCLARFHWVHIQVEFKSSNGLDYGPIMRFGATLKAWVGRMASKEGAEIGDLWDSFQLWLVIFLCTPGLYPVHDSITYCTQVWKIVLMWLVLCFQGLFSASVLSNWICFHLVFRDAFYLP